MNARQPGIDRSKVTKDLHYLRLMALPDELVRENAVSRSTANLHVDHRTLTARPESGRLTRRMRVGPSLGHGVVGPPSPVAVGQRGGTVLAVGRQQPFGVAFTDSHDLRCLPYRKVVFQHGVEYLASCLFSLFQRHFPHGVTFSLNS